DIAVDVEEDIAADGAAEATAASDGNGQSRHADANDFADDSEGATPPPMLAKESSEATVESRETTVDDSMATRADDAVIAEEEADADVIEELDAELLEVTPPPQPTARP